MLGNELLWFAGAIVFMFIGWLLFEAGCMIVEVMG